MTVLFREAVPVVSPKLKQNRPKMTMRLNFEDSRREIHTASLYVVSAKINLPTSLFVYQVSELASLDKSSATQKLPTLGVQFSPYLPTAVVQSSTVGVTSKAEPGSPLDPQVNKMEYHPDWDNQGQLSDTTSNNQTHPIFQSQGIMSTAPVEGSPPPSSLQVTYRAPSYRY